MIKAVIEISKGSRKKNEIKATGNNRVLYNVERRFIANYGKIPGTLAGDGDSADIFVLGKRLKARTQIDSIPYAIVEYTHRDVEDNKVIAFIGKFTLIKKLQFARLLKFLNKQSGIGELGGAAAAEQYVKSKSIKECIKTKTESEMM